MYKRLIYIGLISLMTVSSFSQDKPDFKSIDKSTYELYLKGDWKSLISTSKEAIIAGIDYYYLRIRLGIAYYSKKNYVQAAKQFEIAKTFNSRDTLLLEYLYYSYKYAGLIEQEQQLKKELSAHMKNKMGVNDPNILSVYYEGGMTFNNDYEHLKESDIKSNYVVNDQLFPRYSIYNNLAIKHKLGKKVSVTHAYTNLYVRKFQRIQEVNGALSQYVHESSQNQYYIDLNLSLGNNYNFHLASNGLWINSYFTLTDFEIVSNRRMPVFRNNFYENFEYITHIELCKRYAYVDAGIFGNFSNFNGYKQKQLGFEFVVLPFGNYNIYTRTKLLSVLQYQTKKIIFDQALGLNIHNTWLEVSGTFGELENYNENKAYIVYNGTDIIKKKYSIMVLKPLNKNLDISLRYNYIEYESWIDQYWPSGVINRSYYPYLTHTVILGVKYKL